MAKNDDMDNSKMNAGEMPQYNLTITSRFSRSVHFLVLGILGI